PLASQRSVDPDLLSRETWLVREGGSGTRQNTEEFFRERGVEASSVMTLGSNGAVKQAAATGLGITLLPAHAVTAELTAGTLVRLPVKGMPLRRSWFVAYLEGTAPAGSAVWFLDLLRSPDTPRVVKEWLGTSGGAT
ncbi:MAG: LysR substrate-binding domain-containing protein, partial [Acidimicrobiales bacterium]